jgi:hypothetical protein
VFEVAGYIRFVAGSLDVLVIKLDLPNLLSSDAIPSSSLDFRPVTMSSSESPASTSVVSATYTGNCHCNNVKYTVTQSPPLNDPSCEVIECNCSICSRNGYLFIYVPDKDVTFDKGTLDDMRVRFVSFFLPTFSFDMPLCLGGCLKLIGLII